MIALATHISSMDVTNRKRSSSQSDISSSSEEAENEEDLDGPGKIMWAVDVMDLRDAPTLSDIQSTFAFSLFRRNGTGGYTGHSEDPSTSLKSNSESIGVRHGHRASIYCLDSSGFGNDAHSDSRSSSVCNLYEQSFDVGLPGEFEMGDAESHIELDAEDDINKLLETVDLPPHVAAAILRKVRRDEYEIQHLRSVISSYEEICLGSMTAQDREGLMSQLPSSSSGSPVQALQGRQQVIASRFSRPLSPQEKAKTLMRSQTTGLASGL